MADTASAAGERKAFKDWFDQQAAAALATQMAGAWPAFDQAAFRRRASRKLNTLEFAQRVQQFSDALRATLPDEVPEALHILNRSLPSVLPDCEAVTDGWLQWPLGQFIADHGVPHLDESVQVMVELTQRFSAEFAVRPFVEQYPEAVFERLLKLTAHDSPHVRRWCSEGVRPRLPWGRKLVFLCDDPGPLWPILDALRDDDELYVRRSVANNLNDIAKDHPDLVIQHCQRWSAGADENLNWVIRHGLRSLIKAGNPAALALIGYKTPKKISVRLKVSPRKVSIGDSVELSASVASAYSRRQQLMIDYVVHFVRKNGTSTEKVFKWTTLELLANQSTDIHKRHSLRLTTVRALYPGAHRVDIQINGSRLATADFMLL